MFSLPFQKARLLKFTETDWKTLERIVESPTSVLVYEEEPLANTNKMLAFGTCLQRDGTGLMRLHIAHTCQEDTVEIRNWDGNLVDPKEKCPVCKKPYGKKIRYDVELIIKYPITLID